jgi:hypothetical protein
MNIAMVCLPYHGSVQEEMSFSTEIPFDVFMIFQLINAFDD